MKKKGKRKKERDGKNRYQVEKQVYRQKNMCIGRKIVIQEEKYGDRIKISMIRRKVHGYHEKIWDTCKAALPRRGSFEKFF